MKSKNFKTKIGSEDALHRVFLTRGSGASGIVKLAKSRVFLCDENTTSKLVTTVKVGKNFISIDKYKMLVRLVLSLARTTLPYNGTVPSASLANLSDSGLYLDFFFFNKNHLFTHKKIDLLKICYRSWNIGHVRSVILSTIKRTVSYCTNAFSINNSKYQKSSFTRKQLAMQQILNRKTSSIEYFWAKWVDFWSADQGYKLFFPELFFRKKYGLENWFRFGGANIEAFGAFLRFGSYAELSGDFGRLCKLYDVYPNCWMNITVVDDMPYLDRLKFKYSLWDTIWREYLSHMYMLVPRCFMGVPERKRKIYDVRKNPDVACLFSNLRWPLHVVIFDKAFDNDYYDHVVIKPCNRLHAI